MRKSRAISPPPAASSPTGSSAKSSSGWASRKYFRSFPRKRESRAKDWMPAFAGMSGESIEIKLKLTRTFRHDRNTHPHHRRLRRRAEVAQIRAEIRSRGFAADETAARYRRLVGAA